MSGLAISFVVASIFVGLGPEPFFKVIDLGNFFPMAIDDRGWMGGSVVTPQGQFAAQGDVTQMVSLGIEGRINRVCDRDSVGYSGAFGPGDVNQQLTTWDRDSVRTQYGLLPGGFASAGTGCTKDGLLSFYADTAGLVIRAGYRDADGMHVLMPALTSDSYAGDINRQGTLLVDADLDGDGFPLTYVCDQAASCTQLIPPGYALSIGQQLTDSGWAVGTAFLAQTFASTAYRWSAETGFTALPEPIGLTRCNGFAVNRSGQVVGSCEVEGQELRQHAFVCLDGQRCLNLNTALDASGAGWVIEVGRSVNRWGAIACQGMLAGVRRGCLLIPQLASERVVGNGPDGVSTAGMAGR